MCDNFAPLLPQKPNPQSIPVQYQMMPPPVNSRNSDTNKAKKKSNPKRADSVQADSKWGL